MFLGLTMADESVVRVWSGNTEFNKKLYEVLSKEEGNVFFSPLSVHTILSLVSQGSEKQTLAEFNHVLNVTYDVARNGYKSVMTSLNNVQDVKLHIANKVYLKDNYKLKSSFKDVAVQNYLAEVENVNFAETEKAATTINKWVEGKTNNKIKELISPNDLDEFTRMVLVNAVYFKGEWLHKFKKTSTSKMPFRTSATDSKEVDMMFQTDDFNYAEIDELDAQVLELPYKNKDVSMFILLPKKVDGIKELEAKMKDYDLSTVHEKMRSTEVKVFLPKFKVETTMQLNEPLKKVFTISDMISSSERYFDCFFLPDWTSEGIWGC